MLYKKIIYLSLFLLVLCGGCGLQEGVVLRESKSSLWFTGDTKNAVVYIDKLAPISLKNTNGGDFVHYEISPGKHLILIEKMGEEVVNREVLLGSGMTTEIQIP